LRDGTHRLSQSSESAALDCELLLCFTLNVNRAHLKTWPEKSVDQASAEAFYSLLKRRAQGEPIAYILGEQEFWSLRLRVNEHTLIPRPETELLVEQALLLIPDNTPFVIADLGTGSGAIALAIAKEKPAAKLIAVDVSSQAIAIAQENAQTLGITNIEFRRGSWFEPLHESLDMIVSNPPYIALDDPHLQQGDLRFEPSSALSSGVDGLDAIRHLVSNAHLFLRKNGYLLMEHGWDQADAIQELLSANGFDKIQSYQDLANIARVTLGRLA